MATSTVVTNDKIKQLEERIKKLENELNEQKVKSRFFDEHLEHFPEVYYRFNIRSNRYDYVSPKIKDLTGYSVEEFKKKTIQDANAEIHPDDIAPVLKKISQLHDNPMPRSSTRLVYRRRFKNGKYLWVQDNLTLLKDKDNNPLAYIGNAKDITKQKLEEQKHKEDKKLNQFILDSNPNPIYVKNSDGHYLMANKALADFFEIDPVELLNRLNSDFSEELDKINLYDKWERKVLHTGKPITYEEKFTSPSGHIHYFQTTKTTLNIPGQSPLILVNSTDITDKKKAENNLKLSEALYKNLINSLNFPFLMLDNRGYLKVVNTTAKQWLNLEKKKLGELHWKKLDTLRKIVGFRDESLFYLNKPADFECSITRNGKTTWYWCNVKPINDHCNEKVGIQIIIFDITTRKKTIEKLRYNEITFKGIINASSDLIFLINNRSRVVTANQAAQKYLHMTLEEMMDKNAMELFGEKDGNRRQKLADLVFKTKKIQYVEEHTPQYNVSIYMYPIFNEKGQVDQIAIMVRDISALKKAETEIRNNLKKEKELNQLRSGVISTVSHEFRTPLAVILSNIQVVQKYHKHLSPAQFNSKFDLIYGSINQMNYMLDNISLLDKNSRGLLRYNPLEFSLKEELEQVVGELSSINRNTDRVQIRYNANIRNVVMDPMLLRHILSNLLSNALKFSEDDEKVDFAISKDKNNKLVFEITDQGIGIHKNELENIWEPFFRGSNCEGIKGTGIGISIVKSCTDLCGGKIKIKSNFGKGTKVFVVLPYQEVKN